MRAGGRARDLIFLTTTYGQTIASTPPPAPPVALRAAGHRHLPGQPADHDRHADRRPESCLSVCRLSRRLHPQARRGYGIRGALGGLADARDARPDPREDRRGAEHKRRLAGGRHRRLHRRRPALSGARGDDRPRHGAHHPCLELAGLEPPRADEAGLVPSERLRHLGAVGGGDRARQRPILVATGNGPFNGATNWGDSVLELSPSASRLLHNWTPRDQARLDVTDTDLGSTAPRWCRWPATGWQSRAVRTASSIC